MAHLKWRRLLIGAITLATMTACGDRGVTAPGTGPGPDPLTPPELVREARGVWIVRARTGIAWTSRMHFGTTSNIQYDAAPDRILVNAVDAAGNASTAADWRR